MEFLQRTVHCGKIGVEHIGQKVILNGWLHRLRTHGKLTFINLRDRYGIAQVVIESDASEELQKIAAEVKSEYCLAIRGIVRSRPENMVNKDMSTGQVEVVAETIQILSTSDVLPFVIEEKTKAKEDLRLTWRYLDLRSHSMQKKIALRHSVAYAIRKFLCNESFYEVETPTFIKSTPEGARDYLVPSRLYPGKFYALPQSPQLYKQLLMVGGVDRYFQLARCYRDEDSRGDRQPEFTQLDIEMSFVKREDVLALIEELLTYVFQETLGVQLQVPFKRLSWEEAMDTYGTDKPDLRFGMKLQDANNIAALTTFAAFKEALAEGGSVKALVVPGQAAYTRKQIEELEEQARVFKAKGLAWTRVSAGGTLEAGIARFFEGRDTQVLSLLGAQPGDLLLFIADSKPLVARQALGSIRATLGKNLGLCPTKDFAFVWVVDFPMFEYDEDAKVWAASHHLFTMPQEKYWPTLESNPAAVKADLYDLVLNGCELASGSIRIHNAQLQKRIFSIAGIKEEEALSKFGFLLDAFRFGPPPHGGIAAGLDRLIMLMAGESSIKEVIAFPKNSFAVSPMDSSPQQ